MGIMEKINKQMYQANIDLVDKNKLLEKDIKNMQKKMDEAIEYLKEHKPVCSSAILMNILLGSD